MGALSPLGSGATRALLLLALAACAPKVTPPAAPVEPAAPAAPAVRPTRLQAPGPTAEHPWTLPAPAVGTLSNGIPVYVVENHEVPIVDVHLSWRGGSNTDPKGKEGLASATMDMLARGAGTYDAEALTRAAKKLGTNIESQGGVDAASVALSALTRNLAPSLDLLSTVVNAPTFPEKEWTLLHKQYDDSITSRRQDPTSTAWTVLGRVVYGESYQGRFAVERSLAAIRTSDMKAWRKAWLVAPNASIYVGGDTTLAEILPMLEARFGRMTKTGKAAPAVPAPTTPTTPTITLVDKPGAAQSVIVATRYLGRPTDPGYADLYVANAAWGGMFTSRLNMNLREDKGYTYGARSSIGYDAVGARWSVSAPVQSDKTLPSLQELFAELAAPGKDRPFTDAEIAAAKGSILNGYPLPFESPGALLGLLDDVRLYGLGDTWVDQWLPRVQAVTAASAQAAWATQATGAGLRYVVVGDAAKLREPLATLGFTVEERDADGAVLPSKK